MPVAAHHTLTNYHSAPKAPAAPLTGWLAGTFRRWREVNAERRELALMDERALRDARITRWDVHQELARPFWRG